MFAKGERLGNSLQTERSEGEESMRERWEDSTETKGLEGVKTPNKCSGRG